MPFDEQELRQELGRDERLLWTGKPAQGVRFRSADIFMVPFTLMWAGFAAFWEYSVVASKDAPFFMMLWGIPFVLVGFYITIGRFFLDSYQRARTCYGVTDERVIIVGGVTSREVKSLPLHTLSDISLSERADRSGSITFGPTNPMYAMWPGMALPGMARKAAPTFEFIDDARRVYGLIREAQREMSNRRKADQDAR
jgi:PH (Pleckstrin Homology) domain-containing protein